MGIPDKHDMTLSPWDASTRAPRECETTCAGCDAVIDDSEASAIFPCGCEIDNGQVFCKTCIEALLDDGEHDKKCEGEK